jgi:hypothetical protein
VARSSTTSATSVPAPLVICAAMVAWSVPTNVRFATSLALPVAMVPSASHDASAVSGGAWRPTELLPPKPTRASSASRKCSDAVSAAVVVVRSTVVVVELVSSLEPPHAASTNAIPARASRRRLADERLNCSPPI